MEVFGYMLIALGFILCFFTTAAGWPTAVFFIGFASVFAGIIIVRKARYGTFFAGSENSSGTLHQEYFTENSSSDEDGRFSGGGGEFGGAGATGGWDDSCSSDDAGGGDD